MQKIFNFFLKNVGFGDFSMKNIGLDPMTTDKAGMVFWKN